MSDPAAYTVGWICAMTTEYVAARVFLDEQHDHPEHTSIHDFNDYTLGKIGDHNVVIACVPDGEYGSASATNVVTNLLHSFANVKVGLLVGIGGGAPSSQHDVRLGDVVVSTAEVGKSGVVQFDFGRKFQHGEPFMTGAMNQTPNVLRTAVSELRTQHTICGNNIAEKIENLLKSRPRLRKRYERPSRNKDRLFKSSVSHDEACEESCSITPDHLVSRVHRDSDSDDPVIHYGLIASTNLVMKDARIRDQLARDEQVLCIDMAAFGLMNHFPCLVIRGICDYVDSHRGKEWQGFAAMTAAAYAKDLIRIIHVKSETNLSLSEFVSAAQSMKRIYTDENVESRTRLKIDHQTSRIDELSKREACLQIFRTTADQSSKDLITTRSEGTCTWVLEHDYFQTWLVQDSGLLLISADPGWGKSVLAKYLIEEVLPRTSTICYFFFKIEKQDTVCQALCSILYQLFKQKPDLIRHALPYFDRDGSRLTESGGSLWAVFESLVQCYETGSVTVVLDALDECASAELPDLIQRIERQSLNTQSGYRKLRYLLTSRPYKDILHKFSHLCRIFPRMHIFGGDEGEAMSRDVDRYIRHRFDELAKSMGSLSIRTLLLDRLFSTGQCTYLWASCTLDQLSRMPAGKPEARIAFALEKLPDDIIQAYEDVLSRTRDHAMTRKALVIVLAAKRPMIAAEMSVAINVGRHIQTLDDIDAEPDYEFETRIRTWCGLMTSNNGGAVLLVHASVRDFLLADSSASSVAPPGRSWHHSVQIRQAHLELARICMRYLLLFRCNAVLLQEAEQSYLGGALALTDYALSSWVYHFCEAHPDDDRTELFELAAELVDPTCKLYAVWFSTYCKVSQQEKPDFSTPLQVATFLGHRSLFKYLLENETEIDSRDLTYGRTALMWAAGRGHIDLVKSLILFGANINALGGPYGCALGEAAYQGHTSLVQLLLDKGADVNVQSVKSDSALVVAASSPKDNQDIVKMLLANDADVNAASETYGNALGAAAVTDREDIFAMLLDHGADLNMTGSSYGSVLGAAVSGNSLKIIMAMLEAGVDVNAKGGTYGNVLGAAASRGHPTTVEVLLRRGADINARSGVYGSAIGVAASCGNYEVVRLLLERGANPSLRDGSGKVPLHMASHYGHLEIVKLLLDHGGSPNINDSDGCTPLHMAARYGHADLARLLVGSGADVYSADNAGNISLHIASEYGHVEVLRLLLAHGILASIPDSRRKDGMTPLMLAARSGHIEVAQLLLATGNVDTQILNGDGSSPLSLASVEGHSAMIKLLQARVPLALDESGYSSTGYSESYATLHSESDDTYNDLMVMYVRELVDAIEAEVPFNRYNSQILERLELVVPDLLKGLALSLGHCTKEPAYLTLMVFIYKKRRDITVALIEAFTPDDTFPASAVPWMDRTNLWWRHTDSQEQTNLDDDLDQPQSFVPDYASPSRDEEQGTNDNSSYDAETQALSGYRTLLLQSPPYQWFIQTLQRECRVDAMSPNHMDTVRMRVLEHLPTSRIVSRRRPSESYKVLFRIDWDPVTFLLDQGYEGNLRDVVDIVVTLTGGMDDAQALTCSEYMRQTWPSSGSQILHLIKDVVSCDRGQHHTCHIPNNTVITAWTIGPEFMVEACGTAYSVAEIGEQFAWLGAALRSSPHESGVTLIIAYIDDIVRNDQADKAHEMAVPSQSTVSLKFKMERQSENSDQPEKNKASSCQCWHEMFQNPVVVQGFPFLRRSEYHTGLELPLNMMAGLIDAERISVFEEKLFIKGHTRMLVPTRSTEDFLLWHLLQKEDGRPISFLDNPGAHATNLSVSHVKEVRNIVGWCSRAKLCAGAADARYDIKDSRLTRASPHSMLHKADLFKDEPIADVNTILISGDMELFKTPLVAQQGNITFLKPRSKQKPYVFVDRIRDISRQHVVLWDVQDQRGWLVNGSTALLHVLRANLEFRRRDEFGSGCLFEPRTMVEASEPGLSYSASQVLKNVSNRTLTVHQEDGTTSDERGNAILRLEALIEEFREALVKLGALQRKYNEITAMQRSSGDSECLEGWDFRDLAIQRKDCYPRVSSPIPISQSWALLLRSLNAVTIFGRDLGDLIVPYKDCSPCGHWVQLPSKQYYLAALVFDLHKIMDNESGSEHTSPRTLTSDLEWHDSGEKYDSCSCTGISTEKHADLVQLIGPLRSSQVQDGNTLALYERGAVIFGPQKETWKRNEKLESTGDVITRDGEGHISGENQSISIEEHISIPPPSSLSVQDNTDIGRPVLRQMLPEAYLGRESASRESEEKLELQCKELCKSMRQPPQPFNREDFRTAIVCALSTEFDAMRALLDGRYYCDYGKARNDPNSYVQGYIGGHNVVLVHMKVMGKVEAASVASTIPVSYPNIKLGLLVGICGGVPGGGESERVLGDIVISTGVVQFDKGAEYPDRFRRKNTLKDNLARPNSSIQRFLETTRNPHEKRFLAVLTDFFMLQLCYQDGFIGLGYLGVERDTLHRPNYYHKHRDTTLCKDEHGKRCAVKEHGGLTICEGAISSTCAEIGCDPAVSIRRQRLSDSRYAEGHTAHANPDRKIHFGDVASGDKVMKSGELRDKIAAEQSIIAFEMEGAGMWDYMPTIVIKSICDYADSHKDKDWQKYAAATAAACAKGLLYKMESEDPPSRYRDHCVEQTLYKQQPAHKTESEQASPVYLPHRTREGEAVGTKQLFLNPSTLNVKRKHGEGSSNSVGKRIRSESF